MNVFMEFFVFFMSILQFLFPFAFKDTEVPEQSTAPVVDETVIPDEHEHTGGNYNCLQSAICEICGELYGSRGDHAYTATVTPATCEEGGYTTYRCRFCLDTRVDDYTKALGHDTEVRTTKATCRVPGYEITVCKRCDYTKSTETEPAKGHTYKDTYFSENCTQGYRVEHKCEICKYTYSEEQGSSLGHEYSGEITLPTCQVGGYTTYTCIRCPDSYIADRTTTVGHKYTSYTSNNDATCTSGGTKTAYCDYDCGNTNTIAGDGPLLPHVDNNKDTVCDAEGCTARVYMDFSYLQYPEEALANVNLTAFLDKADASYGKDAADDVEIYVANKRLEHNGVIKSPYFTAAITGRVDGNTAVTTQNIPVYGTIVYVGETEQGALHSFSEIYIASGAYDTFAIEIKSGSLNITGAELLSPAANEKVTVANGKATAILSGLGTHAIILNGNQQYVYTVHVREAVNDQQVIDMLSAGNDRVVVIDGYMRADFEEGIIYDPAGKKADIPLDKALVHYGDNSDNAVLYLKKGAYLTIDKRYDINNADDEANKNEVLSVHGKTETAQNVTGIGQNRFGAITVKDAENVKILGYGIIDLSNLDRSERRGTIFAFANNAHIQGVKLINAPQWTNVFYRCYGLYIRDVDVYGYRQNSDAFDLCNCHDVTVEGCFTRSGDDAFVVKTLDGDENATSNNVTVQNCDAWVGKARAFGIFGETYRDISNVTFRDNRVLFHDATWDYLRIPAIGIVVEGDEENTALAQANSNTTLTNITFENIEICRNKSSAISCIIYKLVENYRINGLNFRNISAQNPADASAKSTINRFSSSSEIERTVVFENIFFGGTKVTNQNFTNYFNPEATHYCGSFK